MSRWVFFDVKGTLADGPGDLDVLRGALAGAGLPASPAELAAAAERLDPELLLRRWGLRTLDQELAWVGDLSSALVSALNGALLGQAADMAARVAGRMQDYYRSFRIFPG